MALQPSIADSVPLQTADTKGQDASPPAVTDLAAEVLQSNGWLKMDKQAILALALFKLFQQKA